MMSPSVNSREGSFCIGKFGVFSDIINRGVIDTASERMESLWHMMLIFLDRYSELIHFF